MFLICVVKIIGKVVSYGMFSPVLWSIVIDSIIKRLIDEGIYAQGYSDDLTIMFKGKFSTLGDRMRTSVKIVEGLCQENGLNARRQR